MLRFCLPHKYVHKNFELMGKHWDSAWLWNVWICCWLLDITWLYKPVFINHYDQHLLTVHIWSSFTFDLDGGGWILFVDFNGVLCFVMLVVFRKYLNFSFFLFVNFYLWAMICCLSFWILFIYAGITADEYKKCFICHHQSLLVSFGVCWVRPCLNGHGYVRRVDIEDDKCWRIFEVLTNQSDICGNFFLCSFWFGLLHVIKCDLMNSSSIKCREFMRSLKNSLVTAASWTLKKRRFKDIFTFVLSRWQIHS